MNPLLRDLCRHQAWADAEHWRVIEQHPPAAADPAIRSRLHHIHQVQRAFVWAVGSGETMPKMTKVEDFGSLDELKAYARDSHGQFTGVLETVTATRLDERIAIPWFQNPALYDHGNRGADAMRDAQPLPSRTERDATPRTWCRAPVHGLDRVVLEKPARAGMDRGKLNACSAPPSTTYLETGLLPTIRSL